MSYILDALNKAERERRLGRIPDLHQPPAPTIPSRLRRWLMSLVLLVLAGNGLLAATLLPWPSWLTVDPVGTAPIDMIQTGTDAGESVSSVARIELAEQPLPVDAPIPLSALPADLRRSLGPLNLDLHVYASQPERRFVLINSQRYRPGDWLSEGPLLEAIEADGVILGYRGRRFTLFARP